jgi:predicted deacylase
MENPVTAPVDGTVELRVGLGDVVAADQVVAVVHPG